jgi:hypothetical protein
MVAYAYAAQWAGDVDRLVLMEAFLPGIGDWNSVFLLRDLWHFHFYGTTNGFTSNISGTISQPIPPSRSPKPIANSTRKSMRGPIT